MEYLYGASVVFLEFDSLWLQLIVVLWKDRLFFNTGGTLLSSPTFCERSKLQFVSHKQKGDYLT